MFFGIVLQAIPSIVREADTTLFDQFDTPTRSGVLISLTSVLVLLMNISHVVLLHEFICYQHGFSLLILFLLFGRTFALGFLYLDVAFLCQMTNRIRETQFLLLLDECDSVTAFATAEAVERVAHRINMERRRLFIVQRAAALELTSGWLHLGVVSHNVTDVGLQTN